MCSNIFCIAPEEVDIVYFIILLIATILNCLIALGSLLFILRHLIRRLRGQVPSSPSDYPPISIVMPCYLPNEQHIIESSIDYMLTKLEYPARLTMYIVYNTPTKLQIEDRLLALDGRDYAPNRLLRVVEAAGSTSKAENLNYVLQLVDDALVALYDADHHPDPPSLMHMRNALAEYDCDAVQGSTYLRDTEGSVVSKIVNAEFFVTHFVYFPAMEMLSGTGYFGGSNALWRTNVLRKYGFDASVHTEDVDLSARVILDQHRIHFCSHARSGELSPAGPWALMTQRLRWFVGWEQVTRKFYWRVFWSPLSPLRKLGFCYMFHLRWGLLLAGLVGAVINPVITSPFIYPLPTWSLGIQTCVDTAVTGYFFVAAVSVCTCVWYEGSHPSSWLWIIFFFVFGPAYVAVHFTLQTVALFRVISGNVGTWTVTRRAGSSAGASTNAGTGASGRAKACAQPSLNTGRNGAAHGLREPLLAEAPHEHRVDVCSVQQPQGLSNGHT